MTSSPKYLPIILALLTLASLVSAVVLQAIGKDAQEAWTAFLAFGGTLLGVHIPSPSSSSGSGGGA